MKKVGLAFQLLTAVSVLTISLILVFWAFEDYLSETYLTQLLAENQIKEEGMAQKILRKVQLNKEIEDERNFKLYSIYKVIQDEDDLSDNPLLMFIVPSHGQRQDEYFTWLQEMRN